jgi:hypothetical protein
VRPAGSPPPAPGGGDGRGHGRSWSRSRLVDTGLGGRLRHRAHHATSDGDWHTLAVHIHDPETGLGAEVTYRSPDGMPALRSEVTLRNEGQATLHLESVSSLVVGGLTTEGPEAVGCGQRGRRRRRRCPRRARSDTPKPSVAASGVNRQQRHAAASGSLADPVKDGAGPQ